MDSSSTPWRNSFCCHSRATIHTSIHSIQHSERHTLRQHSGQIESDHRMQILDEAGIKEDDEMTILEFCCDISTSPYNRRTKKPLSKIMEYMLDTMNLNFPHDSRFGFRWWWAFCKKYSISSLYYGNNNTDVWTLLTRLNLVVSRWLINIKKNIFLLLSNSYAFSVDDDNDFLLRWRPVIFCWSFKTWHNSKSKK